MARAVFDALDDRIYEYGIDRGMIYFLDGTAVPWNGLTAVDESNGSQTLQTHHLDGYPYLHRVTQGSYQGTISAYTYPDEFLRVEGAVNLESALGYPGMYAIHQPAEPFNFCYRTRVGSVENSDLGYKLHMLYGVTALPTERNYQTLSADPEASDFSWEIRATPQFDTVYPASHVIFDSRYTNSWWLTALENMLYGTDSPDVNPLFPSYLTLMYNFTSVNEAGPGAVWAVTVVDNGDGTWTATDTNGEITMVSAYEFSITDINATYTTAGVYDMETS